MPSPMPDLGGNATLALLMKPVKGADWESDKNKCRKGYPSHPAWPSHDRAGTWTLGVSNDSG
jgi:hypothetical protein